MTNKIVVVLRKDNTNYVLHLTKRSKIFVHDSSHFIWHFLSISYKQMPLISKFFSWKFAKIKYLFNLLLKLLTFYKNIEHSENHEDMWTSMQIQKGVLFFSSLVIYSICSINTRFGTYFDYVWRFMESLSTTDLLVVAFKVRNIT